RVGDDMGLFAAHRLLGGIEWTHGRTALAEPEMVRALEHARRAGAQEQASAVLGWIAGMLVWGPTPAEQGLAWCERTLAESPGNRVAEGSVLRTSGVRHAMLGRAEQARATAARGRAMIEDLGLTLTGAMRISSQIGLLEDILGDLHRSEAVIRPGLELLIRQGEKSFLSTLAPTLGWLLARGGQLDEAEDLAIMGRGAAPPDDFASQVAWRQSVGWVLAGRGR